MRILLRQRGEDARHPVHLRIQGAQPPDDLLQGEAPYQFAPQCHHPSVLALGQGLNGRCTEPGSQYPVEGRGISTPLRMPHHRQARLVGASGVDVLVELCGWKFGPFGRNDNEV